MNEGRPKADGWVLICEPYRAGDGLGVLLIQAGQVCCCQLEVCGIVFPAIHGIELLTCNREVG